MHTNMKIYSSLLREECEVFGVAVSLSDNLPKQKRIVLYIEDKGARGLCVEELKEVKIIDARLSRNFKFHIFPENDGFVFLWEYFDDLAHLGRVGDFEPDAVADFEKARSSMPF